MACDASIVLAFVVAYAGVAVPCTAACPSPSNFDTCEVGHGGSHLELAVARRLRVGIGDFGRGGSEHRFFGQVGRAWERASIPEAGCREAHPRTADQAAVNVEPRDPSQREHPAR